MPGRGDGLRATSDSRRAKERIRYSSSKAPPVHALPFSSPLHLQVKSNPPTTNTSASASPRLPRRRVRAGSVPTRSLYAAALPCTAPNGTAAGGRSTGTLVAALTL